MKRYMQDIIRRKDLIFYLVVSELKSLHKNSFLGYLWWMLDPLLGVAVYYFLMVVVLNRGGTDYGPFLVVGLVVFRSISSTMTQSAKSITRQSGIISQVYLPKAIFPFATSLSQLINFSIGLLVIGLFLIIFRITPSLQLLWLPYVLVSHLLFMTCLSMFIGYICVFVRDVENFLSHFIMLLRYGSPVIWKPDMLPARVRWISEYNPLTTYLDSYRNILLYDSAPAFFRLNLIGLISLLLIVLMLFHYHRHEHKIIKVL